MKTKILQKKYKDEDPIKTINNIRNILNNIGILVTENFRRNGDFFACRIQISNNDLGKYAIGTNGKGTSLEYAMASAYAEFMERLQNGLLIPESYYFSNYYIQDSSFNRYLISNKLKTGFVYTPEEKIISINEVFNERRIVSIIEQMFHLNKDQIKRYLYENLGCTDLITVPFANKDGVVYLPIDVLLQCTGSTGMCAGNTCEEALVQGLSEILERYAISEVFYKRLTPPTIPLNYFKDTSVYRLVKKIENKGFNVVIKDFSLGRKLPVIGVLIVDKKNHKYNVKVGCDPWPLTALERCLTELHQSFNDIRLIEINDILDKSNNHYDDFINITKIMNNSSGHWHLELFGKNYSYDFKSLNFSNGISNKLDLKYMLDLFHELGSDIYIRDVSSLGFKSYYILAANLQLDKRTFSHHKIYNDIYNRFVNMFCVAPYLSIDNLKILINLCYEYYDEIRVNSNNYLNYLSYRIVDKEIVEMDIDLFLCMANYKIGNNNDALKYIKLFLTNKNTNYYTYFFACKDYLSLLLSSMSSNDIIVYLESFYEKELINSVINDMKEPNDIFKSYKFKSYFEMETDDINEYTYINFAYILKNIEKIQVQNTISQELLSNILKEYYSDSVYLDLTNS